LAQTNRLERLPVTPTNSFCNNCSNRFIHSCLISFVAILALFALVHGLPQQQLKQKPRDGRQLDTNYGAPGKNYIFYYSTEISQK